MNVSVSTTAYLSLAATSAATAAGTASRPFEKQEEFQPGLLLAPAEHLLLCWVIISRKSSSKEEERCFMFLLTLVVRVFERLICVRNRIVFRKCLLYKQL